MAQAVKDTPILYGKDALKFNAKIIENKNNKISTQEREKLKESFAKFKIVNV